MYKFLKYECLGNRALITLNRPEHYNALTAELKQELVQVLGQVSVDPNIRVVILTGSGDKAFCSGQDLQESLAFDTTNLHLNTLDWIFKFKEVCDAFRNLEKVSIAMLNGVATGAGLQIALMCDLRIAATSARLGMSEINVGFPLITGSGMLWPLIGPARTRELALTARLLSASEALSWGLVNQVINMPDLKKHTLETADQLAQKSELATLLTKNYYKMLEEGFYNEIFNHSAIAHERCYAAGEPQKWQAKFFANKK